MPKPLVIVSVLAIVVGLILVILGALAPGIVAGMLKTEVNEKLRENTKDGAKNKADSSFMRKDQPYIYHFFNITNAKDVILGAKPVLNEVKVDFTLYKQKYDFKIDESGDTYSYEEYDFLVADTEADWDIPLITINPVYTGAVIGQGRTELAFQSNFAAPAVAGVFAQLTGEESLFAGAVRVLGFPGYFKGMWAALMTLNAEGTTPGAVLGAAYPDWENADFSAALEKIKNRWGGNDVTPSFNDGLTTVQVITGAYGDAIAAPFTGFDCVSTPADTFAMNSSFVDLLFTLSADAPAGTPATFALSLVNSLAVFTWAVIVEQSSAFLMALGAYKIDGTSATSIPLAAAAAALDAYLLSAIAPLFDAAVGHHEWVTVTANTYDNDMTRVLGYLAGFLGAGVQRDVVYFGALKKGFLDIATANNANATAFTDAAKISLYEGDMVAIVASALWEDFIYLQFGRSLITRSVIEPRGSVWTVAGRFPQYTGPSFEITDYDNALHLSLSETRQFETFFGTTGGQLSAPVFSGASAAGLSALAPWDSAGVVGAAGERVMPSIMFLISYLPETFVIGSFLSVDDQGVNPVNSGLFVKHTVRELLTGYEDFLLQQRGLPAWQGLYGPNVDNITYWKAISDVNPTRTVMQRATKDIKRLGEFVAVDGVNEFTLATDLGRSCPGPGWGPDQSCKVWDETEVIKGSHSVLEWPPHQQDEKPISPYDIYINIMRREVTWEYKKEIDVKGITMRQYVIAQADFNSAAANAGDEAAVAKSTNYRMSITGTADMSTSSNWAPLWISVPHMYMNQDERDKISGLTDADWEDGDAADFFSWVAVEPITGKLMKAVQRLQANMKLDKAAWGGLYKNMWFGGAGSEHVFFPIYWAFDGNEIGSKDAAEFVDKIYGATELGESVLIGGVTTGIILMLFGVAIALFVVKTGSDSSVGKLKSSEQEMA